MCLSRHPNPRPYRADPVLQALILKHGRTELSNTRRLCCPPRRRILALEQEDRSVSQVKYSGFPSRMRTRIRSLSNGRHSSTDTLPDGPERVQVSLPKRSDSTRFGNAACSASGKLHRDCWTSGTGTDRVPKDTSVSKHIRGLKMALQWALRWLNPLPTGLDLSRLRTEKTVSENEPELRPYTWLSWPRNGADAMGECRRAAVEDDAPWPGYAPPRGGEEPA